MFVRSSDCPSVNFHIFRFTGFSSYQIELTLDRMILDSLHNRWKSDFGIFFQGSSAVGARLLKSSNQFTAYIFHLIELKLGRMMLDISPHNRFEPDFSVLFQGGCESVHA